MVYDTEADGGLRGGVLLRKCAFNNLSEAFGSISGLLGLSSGMRKPYGCLRIHGLLATNEWHGMVSKSGNLPLQH